MKIAVWIFFALLAASWTAGAALASGVTRWSAELLSSGTATELGRQAAQWPVPSWLALWADPAWIRAAQQTVLWSLDAVRDALPWIGSAVGWLVPFIWVVWGLGLLMMLGLAGGAHWLLGRSVQAPRTV